MMKPTVAIVGCGRVGTNLGLFLSRAGYPLVGLAGRHGDSVRKAGEIIGMDRVGTTAWEMTPAADVVFITTPDGVIRETCDAIARHGGFRKNGVVLHCSGAHPSTILDAARACGAVCGSMHPLQSFASVQGGTNPFKGIIAALEGEPAAVQTARRMATDLGATCYTIETDAKVLYHASAVVASNYLVALLDFAFGLLGRAGITGSDAMTVLGPLIRGTLANVEKVGIPKALTGPIARGDVETVQRHLDEIGSRAPESLSLYKALGIQTLDVARAGGALPETVYARLGKILSSTDSS